MQTRFPVLSFADLEFVATRDAGLGWLRSKLGLAGLYGRGLSPESERCVRAARHGLVCGWSSAGDQGELYTGEERRYYLGGLRSGEFTVQRAEIAGAA